MEKRKHRHRAHDPAGGEHWRLDPSEVGFHARRMRQANRTGPLGKLARYAAGALALAAAVALYLNFDTVRQIRLDFSAFTDLFAGNANPGGPGTPPRSADELPTEVVQGGGVAGESLPTSIDGETPAANRGAAEPPAAASTAPQPAPPAPAELPSLPTEPLPRAAEPADDAPAVARVPPPAPAPAREPEPERPVTPEAFHFGLTAVSVSEADASAAVIVLREGGRRGVSSFKWWTTDGTATAGSDYASLGEVVQPFAVGQQNVTIRVPIIGDRNVEGPETFFVHLAPSEADAAAGEPAQRLEVVINDDD